MARQLTVCCIICLTGLVAALSAQPKPATPEVALAKDGKAILSIFVAAEPGVAKPAKKAATSDIDKSVADLRRCLQRITGAEFTVTVGDKFPAEQPKPGIFIGKATDFSSADVPKDMGPEEFLLRSTAQSQLLLVGGSDAGMSDAIYALLEKLGCRWYFPGATWEVIPKQPALSVSVNERQKPDIGLQRHLAVGHGLHSATIARDYNDWTRRNRMPGTLHVTNSHVWPGINPDKDFATHPEWFALVKGERKPSKPCYANPEVIARGVAQSLAHFDKNPSAQMVSVSAPDGAGYCECELCRKAAQVEKIYPAHGPGGLFGKTADGKEVSVVSETIFLYTNEVADAVAKKYPGKYVGMIAYSSYAHPPSFALKPNVYVEVTQGYRRTPLSFAEQIADFAGKAKHLGAYEYYDVEQWSWDLPGKARAAHLDYHASTIPWFVQNHVDSIKGEVSNNWGPNGIGYYVLGKLMWDSSANVHGLEEEFYRKAFGPAAAPLERFYRRWESGQGVDQRTLGLAYRDLQEAVKLTADQPEYRARVDQVRMYLHFVKSYHFMQDFPLVNGPKATKQSLAKFIKQYGEEELKQKVSHLGDYTRRLMDTGMVHSFAFNSYFKGVGNALGCDTANWQKPGTIPTAEEIDRQFEADLKEFDLTKLQDVALRPFSRDLISLKEARPDLMKEDGKISSEPCHKGSLYVQAKQGDAVSVTFAPSKTGGDGEYHVSFVTTEAFSKGWTVFGLETVQASKLENGTLRFEAKRPGFYRIEWTEAAVTAVSHPAVFVGGQETSFRHSTLYFFVPKGTQSFAVKARPPGGAVVLVRDSAGTVILDIDKKKAAASTSHEFVIEVPQGSDGAIWSITGPKDNSGNGTIALIGVPNYLSLLPGQLLVPREVAR